METCYMIAYMCRAACRNALSQCRNHGSLVHHSHKHSDNPKPLLQHNGRVHSQTAMAACNAVCPTLHGAMDRPVLA
jgi:hypothetical protein